MTLAVTALIPAAAIVSGGTVVADMAAEAGIRLIGLPGGRDRTISLLLVHISARP